MEGQGELISGDPFLLAGEDMLRSLWLSDIPPECCSFSCFLGLNNTGFRSAEGITGGMGMGCPDSTSFVLDCCNEAATFALVGFSSLGIGLAQDGEQDGMMSE